MPHSSSARSSLVFLCCAVFTSGCLDFGSRLDACRQSQGLCQPDLLQGFDGGRGADAGPSTCVPGCVSGASCVNGVCITTSCGNTTCGAGQVCANARCVAANCAGINCDDRFTCIEGSCVPRTCTSATCASGSACVDGGCVDVSCAGVTCDGGRCENGRCTAPSVCAGQAAGAVCGGGQVCNGAGACVACGAQSACSTNPRSSCFAGVIACGTGAPVCADGPMLGAGAACGSGRVCNSSGSCVACEVSVDCTGNPSQCRKGLTECSTGERRCLDAAPKIAGVACGTGQVCDGAGFCGVCTANEPCTGNGNPCRDGVTDCSTGSRRCSDGAAKAVGASCGSGSVCNGLGSCGACVAGSSCTTNPGAPCLTGKTDCSNGSQRCIDSTPAQTTTYYRDSDGDGFGDKAASTVVCGSMPAAPAGYISNDRDCCDTDARAKPGQTDFFEQADACSSFDYDCNGTSEFRSAQAFTGCAYTSFCSANGLGYPCGASGTPGWGSAAADPSSRNRAFQAASSVPACGNTGVWVNGCSTVGNCGGGNCDCGQKNACEFSVSAGVKQACR